jgi:hypothetical protein
MLLRYCDKGMEIEEDRLKEKLEKVKQIKEDKNFSQIWIWNSTREKLKELRLVEREAYSSVIERLIDFYIKNHSDE